LDIAAPSTIFDILQNASDMPVKTSPKHRAGTSKEVSLSEMYLKLKAIMQEVDIDLPKFETKKNISAGIRVRKALQDVKAISQEIRMHILDASK
jgi:hypothetical protein